MIETTKYKAGDRVFTLIPWVDGWPYDMPRGEPNFDLYLEVEVYQLQV